MPVYEYRCTKCLKVFEYQQRMADAPKSVCEECSGALERLISRSSFALKGDGWYKDLYSSSKPAATTTESKPDPKPSGGDSGSSSGSSGSDSGSSGGSGGGTSGGGGTTSSASAA